MRYYYHLMNASFLLSERCEFGCELDKYVNFPNQDNFVASCLEILSRGKYSKVARDNLDLFRHEMPAAPQFEALIDATFGKSVRI